MKDCDKNCSKCAAPDNCSSHMSPAELKILSKQKSVTTASLALSVLRFCRDESPEEWDAMMKTNSGPVLATLWDILKEEVT